MSPVGVRLGPLRIYVWAGSWSRWGERHLDCGCCTWNLYLGPFGVEWGDR